MNSRSLTPFLISFALSAAALASRLSADSVSLDTGLAAHRSAAVDYSGAPIRADVPAAAPAPATPAPKESETAKAPTYVLTKDLLLSAVREQLVGHFNVEGDLQLELLRTWVDSVPLASPVDIAVLEYPMQLSSAVLVRVKAVSGNIVLLDTSLNLRAQLMREVWITKQPVARDEVFDPTNLDTRKVDCLRERDALPVTSGDKNSSFNRPVQAGRVVSWRDISRRSLVKKGELVEVAAVEGALSVSMRGLALQNGAAGDVISIRNLESKKEISAQVVAENRVQIHF